MGSAAEFRREVADLDDADFISILLAEQRHGFVLIDGHINGHILDHFHFLVAQDFLVDQILDVLQLLVFHPGEMRKIKSQMIGRYQRPCLLHMLAENFA